MHLQVARLELRDEGLDVGVGDVADDRLLLDGQRYMSAAVTVGQIGKAGELAAAGAAGPQRETDVVAAVLLPADADVVARTGRRRRRRPVLKGVAEIFLLQHLAELLDPPVGDEELQPGAVAGLAVAVVAEHPGDAGPHLRHVVGHDEDAEPLGEHRVG
jgi:hypothetical protein